MIQHIPKIGNFGFDDLMNLCLSRDIHVRAHPFDGLWLDIGRPEDYANATRLFQENRARLLPKDQEAPRMNVHRLVRNHAHPINNAIPRTT
jgi:NDP-sugar pyrophosphorylase family protein